MMAPSLRPTVRYVNGGHTRALLRLISPTAPLTLPRGVPGRALPKPRLAE